MHQSVDEDAAAEDAHHFARILGRLWLAPFADLGVTKAIEGVNGAVDDFGSTDDQDFKGTRLGSEGMLAETGVSESGVWSESGIKSSVIWIFLLSG